MRTYEGTRKDVSVAPNPWRRLQQAWSALPESRRDWLLAGVLLLLSLALHLPLRGRYLTNWDSVNYALGVRDFDLVHHQPHPPGYIGYIAVGRLLSYLTGEASAALTLLSAVGGSFATAALYLLVRRFTASRHALVAAVLFGTSPLVLYYSAVALTYIVAAAVIVPYAWLCHRARRDGNRLCLFGGAVLLAALGALRQSDMVLLLPLWLYAAWPFAWRDRFKGTAVLTVLTASWVVPLIGLAGGWDIYVEQSRTLAEYVSSKTTFYGLTFNAEALDYNIRMVTSGLVLGTSVGLVVVALAVTYRIRPLACFDRDDRRFFYAWALPALLAYLLLHTGQFGYLLLVLPVFFIWAGRVLGEVARVRAARRTQSTPLSRRLVAFTTLGALGLIVGANLIGFVWFSRGVYSLMMRDHRPLLRSVASVLAEDPPTREFDLPANDDHWSKLLDLIHEYGPDQAEVLTYMGGSGTFRHLAYYLPDYHVRGIGYRMGQLGVLFSDGTYEVPWYVKRQDVLQLGPEVDRLLITDLWIANRMPEGIPLTRVTHQGGPSIIIATVPKGATLVFRPPTLGRRTYINVLDAEGRPVILPLGAQPRQSPLPPSGLVERRQAALSSSAT
ncbi:MAG: glycosyltransferase family 39 protein [Nitriliruptorales bacterium]